MEKNRIRVGERLIVLCAAVAFALAAFPCRLAAGDSDEWKDENVVIEDDTGRSDSGSPADMVNGGEARRFLQLLDNLRKNSHSFGGSYSHVPAPGWRNDQYEGFLRNSFVIGDSYRLGTNLSYGQSNTFRDRNYPERLYNAAAGLNFSGDRFFLYAGAVNRSDRLFSSFDDISISAAVLGTVYRSGPHGLVIGGVFSLRGELWKYPAPLPLIAYRYVSRTLVVFAGLPFFLAWKPNTWFTLSLGGFLPGVGRVSFNFKVVDSFFITLDYSHTKNSYHLNEYPFHDWRRMEYRVRIMIGQDGRIARFIHESNETGVRFTFRPVDEVSLYAYAGYRFKTTYYLSDNILTRPSKPDRVANALVAKAGAVFMFHSGGREHREPAPDEAR